MSVHIHCDEDNCEQSKPDPEFYSYAAMGQSDPWVKVECEKLSREPLHFCTVAHAASFMGRRS